MATALISSKGQITLPAAARRKFNMKPNTRVEVEVTEREIVIRPAKTIRDVIGIFHEHAKGKTNDWETIRTQAERAVAEEVMNDG